MSDRTRHLHGRLDELVDWTALSGDKWANRVADEARSDLHAWETIGRRIKDGWALINGHRWWRPGDDPVALTDEQKRVLFPPMIGVVE